MATNYLVENNIIMSTASPDVPIISDPNYEVRGVFSLNASNMLQGTLWVTKNGQLMDSNINTASYIVYDKDGNTVGLTEVGISPDANAQYITTPILASVIQDLTHYVVKVTINADIDDRVGYLGLTLGE